MLLRRLGLFVLVFMVLGLGVLEFYFTDKVIAPPRKSFAQYLKEEPTTPPSLESLNVAYQNFEVRSVRNIKISGWYVPGSKEVGVILLHGHGINRLQVMKHVAYLHGAGYPLALIDLQGCGKSSGRFSSLGYLESYDAQAVANWMQSEKNLKQFVAMGFSAGASAALFFAGKDPRVVAVVADSPNTGLVPVALFRGHRDFSFLPDWFYRLGFALIRFRLGLPHEALYLKPVVQNKIHFPVFYIQGKLDDLDGTRFAKELNAISPKGSQVWEVENTKHLRAVETQPQEYSRRVLGYLQTRLLN